MRQENLGCEWWPWAGRYDKKWYDVKLPNGELIRHCWPNAGTMYSQDGSGRAWAVEGKIKVRRSATHPLGDPNE
jgi:hypothetical protein